jgi:hypothetical protein
MLVCTEWQCFFEREAWREIIVKGFNGLTHLESIDKAYRASFIERVIFTMRLPSCTCPTCDSRSDQLAAENADLLSQALDRLLATLSMIDKTSRTENTAVPLRINKFRLDLDLRASSDWSCPSEMVPIYSKYTNSDGGNGKRWVQPVGVDPSTAEQLEKPEIKLLVVESLYVRYPAKTLLPVDRVIERTGERIDLQEVHITKTSN